MDGSAIVLYISNMPAKRSDSTIKSTICSAKSGDLPGVVHCETIAARSVLHDWVVTVHRHARLHQVLLIERGGGEATLDGRDHHVATDAHDQRARQPRSRFQFHTGNARLGSDDRVGNSRRGAVGLRRVARRAVALRCVRGTPQIRATMKQVFHRVCGRELRPGSRFACPLDGDGRACRA